MKELSGMIKSRWNDDLETWCDERYYKKDIVDELILGDNGKVIFGTTLPITVVTDTGSTTENFIVSKNVIGDATVKGLDIQYADGTKERWNFYVE